MIITCIALGISFVFLGFAYRYSVQRSEALEDTVNFLRDEASRLERSLDESEKNLIIARAERDANEAAVKRMEQELQELRCRMLAYVNHENNEKSDTREKNRHGKKN